MVYGVEIMAVSLIIDTMFNDVPCKMLTSGVIINICSSTSNHLASRHTPEMINYAFQLIHAPRFHRYMTYGKIE